MKEKRLSEISALWITFIPTRQTAGADYTNTYRHIYTDGPLWCFVNFSKPQQYIYLTCSIISHCLECQFVILFSKTTTAVIKMSFTPPSTVLPWLTNINLDHPSIPFLHSSLPSIPSIQSFPPSNPSLHPSIHSFPPSIHSLCLVLALWWEWWAWDSWVLSSNPTWLFN